MIAPLKFEEVTTCLRSVEMAAFAWSITGGAGKLDIFQIRAALTLWHASADFAW
jgi:hypothetical protein